MIKNKRSLRIKASLDNIHEVEAFIESICDDYNIFNSYFGIILFSITECFRAIASQNNSAKHTLRLDFKSSQIGLGFKFYIGAGILEIASLLKEKNISSDDVMSDTQQNLQIVKMLCDKIIIEAEKGVFEIVFNIGSINQHLALERSKELERYYSHIGQTSKV
jgi:hypothetical protein